ncbi:MAG: sulfatase [Planctomycetota bacterium]
MPGIRLVCLALTCFLFSTRAAETRPNVLIVIADQWRSQAFGFAGDPNVKTPNLDALAKQSVRFVNAVSGLPVCSPTRATLLTGQRPLTHGVFLNDVQLNPDAVSMAKIMKAANYTTGCIGKWHIDGRGRGSFIPRERRQGFEYWKVLECTHSYNKSYYFADSPDRCLWTGYDANAQTNDVCDYIKKQAKSEKPFAMLMAWGPPHNPYLTAPEKYKAMYQPEKLVLRPNVPAAHAAETRKDLVGYYAHCTALDDCMGQLMKALDDAGIADNTLIIFTSDHGDMLGSQGMQRKQKPWDESARIPMLWRWPAGLGKQGVELTAPMNTEDILPTILGLCKVAIPPSVEGLNYSAHMTGGTSPGDGATVIQCVAPFGEWHRGVGGKEFRGLRNERYTYVKDLNGPWLLYDNVSDPYQMKNLVADAASEALRSELDAVLMRKLKERHDEFLPGDAYVKKWEYKTDARGTVPYKD